TRSPWSTTLRVPARAGGVPSGAAGPPGAPVGWSEGGEDGGTTIGGGRSAGARGTGRRVGPGRRVGRGQRERLHAHRRRGRERGPLRLQRGPDLLDLLLLLVQPPFPLLQRLVRLGQRALADLERRHLEVAAL